MISRGDSPAGLRSKVPESVIRERFLTCWTVRGEVRPKREGRRCVQCGLQEGIQLSEIGVKGVVLTPDQGRSRAHEGFKSSSLACPLRSSNAGVGIIGGRCIALFPVEVATADPNVDRRLA